MKGPTLGLSGLGIHRHGKIETESRRKWREKTVEVGVEKGEGTGERKGPGWVPEGPGLIG